MTTLYKNKFLPVKTLLINYIIVINLAFFGFTAAVQSQPAGSQPIHETLWNDIKAAGDDAAFIGNGLLNINLNDVIITSGVLGGTGLLMLADEDVRSLALRNQTQQANSIFRITNEAGNVLYAGGLSGGMYLGGLLAGNEWTRTTGRLMIESLVLSGAFTTTLKVIIGRSRPYTNDGNMKFNWFEWQEGHWSMPSGHSSTVFAVVSVLAGRIDRWWGYGLYGIAAMTMASRIYYDKHWLSDTFMGGAIGLLSGLTVLEAHKENSKAKSYGLFIVPSSNVITFSYKF
jgi:membrane-associated phospholipid phosphatase